MMTWTERNSGQQERAVWMAILAAALYAISFPFSKLLLSRIQPVLMAALLYLGAGLGMGLLGLVRRGRGGTPKAERLTRRELPSVLAMVALDIAASILLMNGLMHTTAATASLLSDFEIVATALIALLFFREKVSGRLWTAIVLITISSMVLSTEGAGRLRFSGGSLLVLLGCTCWGLENNVTRVLSVKDPLQIVVIKGICSGLGSLVIARILGEPPVGAGLVLTILLLGSVAYGLSIFCYVSAQRMLGAARTSTYCAVAPFIGAALSFLVFWHRPTVVFLLALLGMVPGVWLAATDRPEERQRG